MKKNTKLNIGPALVFGIINLILVFMAALLVTAIMNFLGRDLKNPDTVINEEYSIKENITDIDAFNVTLKKTDLPNVGMNVPIDSVINNSITTYTIDEEIIIPFEIETENPWDGNMKAPVDYKNDKNTESITIPGFTDTLLTETDRYISLSNPSRNSVFFTYTLIENDCVIYEIINMAPGNSVDADLYDVLGYGEHKVSILINTYDVITNEICNGASQKILITVK